MTKKHIPIILLLVFMGAMIGSFVTYYWFVNTHNPVQAENPSPTPGENTGSPPSVSCITGGDSVVQAVQKISPSVVYITTKSVLSPKTSQRRSIPDEFDNFFFIDPYEYFNTPREQQGSGSGIIISSDGLILTNQHVIENADVITVKVDTNPNGHGDEKATREYQAKVVGSDKLTDLAVIKIEAKDLPAATLGDSDSIRIGEWLIAVGNPLGYEHTVTVGVLSARGRNLGNFADREYPNLLQTDAAINPGNSGGALANLNGEVIGVNTAISAQGQGIGFAIPINRFKEVKDELIAKGRIVRPYLGIYMITMDEAKADYLAMPKVEGVLVYKIVEGSPAQQGGLQKGDVVLEVDSIKVNSPEELQKQIRSKKVGDTITLKIWRDKKFLEQKVKIGAMPDKTPARDR